MKQSLGVPFLTRELYVFARTYLCFSTCRQVVCEMFISRYTVKSIPVEKMKSPVIFDTDHSFKRQNALCLTKKIVYESFYGALPIFSYFLLQGSIKFCVLARVSETCVTITAEDLFISGYI